VWNCVTEDIEIGPVTHCGTSADLMGQIKYVTLPEDGMSVFLDFFELQSLHDPLVCTFEGQMKFQRVAVFWCRSNADLWNASHILQLYC